MIDKFQLVTLSGVITDPRAGLNYIMSCFFFSKYSQTDLYRGHVISLSSIIKQYGDDTAEIASAIERDLESLLRRYFPVVSVEARGTDDGADIQVAINGQVVANDSTGEVRLDLGYTLQATDGTFKRIVDTLNEEVVY